MRDYSFKLTDFLGCFTYLLLFTSIAVIIYLRNREKRGYEYFIPHYIWKVAIGFFFSYVYTNVYGGDTTAYFEGAQTLKRLALESPLDYLSELFSSPNLDSLPHYFNAKTGFPPLWIYREENSWFVSKVASLFSFISFDSFYCMNFIFTVISACFTWKFFRFAEEKLAISTRQLAIAILFIPTVGFWCTGIMKDTIVFCSTLVVIKSMFEAIVLKKPTYLNLLKILFFSYLIAATRSFILIAILVPFYLYILFHLNKTASLLSKIVIRFSGSVLAILAIGFFLQQSNQSGAFSANNILATAETTYNDFLHNTLYTGKRYDLGLTDFTISEMLKATPMALLTAIYRPFIWEAASPLMLINGIEGVCLLYFTLKILRRNRKNDEKIKLEDKTKAFIFISFVFCIIMGFFVGFTSVLFGVLVRLKAPILPFFVIVVLHKTTEKKEITD